MNEGIVDEIITDGMSGKDNAKKMIDGTYPKPMDIPYEEKVRKHVGVELE